MNITKHRLPNQRMTTKEIEEYITMNSAGCGPFRIVAKDKLLPYNNPAILCHMSLFGNGWELKFMDDDFFYLEAKNGN